MTRPRLLDLFCGAGGAGEGYHRAGFDVVGVDLLRESSNPHPRTVADVMTMDRRQLRAFDAIHASPPCQRYSVTKSLHPDAEHPDLVGPVRELLQDSGRLWVIENVPGAPVQGITLCGSMFDGLRVRRHRLFESSHLLMSPGCGIHEPVWSHCTSEDWRNRHNVDMWSRWLTVTGHFPCVAAHADAMGIDWMTQKELAQAIPPAYTEFIGRQLLEMV